MMMPFPNVGGGPGTVVLVTGVVGGVVTPGRVVVVTTTPRVVEGAPLTVVGGRVVAATGSVVGMWVVGNTVFGVLSPL
jgi:hypothetical protein